MRFTKGRSLAAALASVLATGTLLAAAPAQAASAGCTAPYWHGLGNRTCTTGSIPANSARYIYISVTACKGSPWKVWDTGTGVTIASGTGSGQGTLIERKVTGLYGNYKGKLTDACYNDEIRLSNWV
ncbi:hypothetical protein KV100_19100 [Mumia sp. zg.B21]|uniref:hypothetical protein n=1 Tax=Mumia sp. zg.B21 TaxID=2855447 RepID=UPI001C6E718C|nr:hypothetical protein [Mumia sp. zg.B21]MBW9211762.1 hypothetical protein [Mumia sp. zg.B21]